VLDANDPPTAAQVSNPIVSTNIAGLALGTISITDQDPGQLYQITSLDRRFSVYQNQLRLNEDAFIIEADPFRFAVPILVTETSPGNASFQLSIPLQRTLSTNPWQNAIDRFDVDRSQNVNPLDVLALVDAINSRGAGKLPQPRAATSLQLPDYDVDGDGELTPLDILQLVNFLNGQTRGALNEEGEFSSDLKTFKEPLPTVAPEIWLTAFNQLDENELNPRKRTASNPSRRDRPIT
jgi:hypothetical protein